jgi:hypothetical protein
VKSNEKVGIAEVKWNNIKKCVLDVMSDFVGEMSGGEGYGLHRK